MRADGRRIKTLDPMFQMMPYLMTRRYDAQVATQIDIDYAEVKRYINAKRKEGTKISFMSVFIAAYARMIAQVPEINRFIKNKKIYARKGFWVSFAVLKQADIADDKKETVVKLKFELTDTIFDIAKKIDDVITSNRKPVTENTVDKLAKFFMGIPLLSRIGISIAKFCDTIGILPKALLDGVPFHTSLFITNLASINTGSVYHHTYDFGTTSIFISMGKLKNISGSSELKKLVVPLGIVVDERICAGVTFARAYGFLKTYLATPSLLETPPEHIREDVK